MSEARQFLENIIRDFSIEKFESFFRNKSDNFVPTEKELDNFNDEDFQNGETLGEIVFSDIEKVLIASFKIKKELSDRSGKKKQYEKAKKILKSSKDYSAGIFIFYDNKGSFRFSLVYPEYFVIQRKFSFFKRFTFLVTPQKTNKTFLSQIGEGDFSSLEKIREAFSVEPITKEFYKEIQNWFFYAKDKVAFPKGYPYSSEDEMVSLNLIRLITRIIFIWFMKEKNLIPESLFEEKEIKAIVKDFKKNSNSSNYYNAILQNLFFATLNQKKSQRGWAENKTFSSNRETYGIKTLYRFEDLFLIDKEKVMEIFKDVPFINGGLFDCLDKENDEGKVIYIDGFSRNEKARSKIPDSLFFEKEEKRVDLKDYGFNSSEPVRGLIDILKTYNFTIDENSPIDQEIALDPELLGRVFENLLACYNPETQTTARKSTGSYYTPREIVEYMVQEAILNYLKTKVPQLSEDDLRILVSYSEEEPKERQDDIKNEIIKALDELKILDPACGSGAFPMGVLHRIVFILQKIDQNNEKWKEFQFQKAIAESQEAFSQNKNKKDREKLLKEINEVFDENINYPDYARKIYLIENCIYGVDIQPIATEISRLRFFISLLIDQKVDKGRENWGIKPLPNLETKFVSANTLIGLEEKGERRLKDPKVEEPLEQLKNIRHKTFSAKSRDEKLKLQKKDKEIRKKIVEELKEDGWAEDTAEKIVKFDIYDHNASADWFDPKWMFGVNEGFDIVIGNPPYIQLQRDGGKLAQLYEKQNYKTFVRTGDIYCLFYEKGIELLKQKGYLCLITSNKWMRAGYGEKLRNFFLQHNPKLLIDLGPNIFESATVDTNIFLIQKNQTPQKKLKAVTLQKQNDTVNIEQQLQERAVILDKLTKDAWFIGSSAEQKLKEKIEHIGKPLKDWDVNIYYGIKTGLNEAFIITTEKRNEILANCKDKAERKRTEAIIKPILRGRDIKRYYYEWAGLWVIIAKFEFYKEAHLYPTIVNHLRKYENELKSRGQCRYTRTGKNKSKDFNGQHHWLELDNNPQDFYLSEFEKEKVVWKALSLEPSFALVPPGFFNNDKANLLTSKQDNVKYLCALMNSKIFQFYFSSIGVGMGQGFEYKIQFVQNIPLPPITPENQPIVKQIEALVNKILKAKKQNPQADTHKLEREIDNLVYSLYNLTAEEIKIIEGRKKL